MPLTATIHTPDSVRALFRDGWPNQLEIAGTTYLTDPELIMRYANACQLGQVEFRCDTVHHQILRAVHGDFLLTGSSYQRAYIGAAWPGMSFGDRNSNLLVMLWPGTDAEGVDVIEIGCHHNLVHKQMGRAWTETRCSKCDLLRTIDTSD